MTQNQLFKDMFRGVHENCKYENRNMEKQVEKFAKLGGFPHCFFAEISKAMFIIPVEAEANGQMDLYSSYLTFNEKNPINKLHVDLSFILLAEKLSKLEVSVINFYGKNNIKIELQGKELEKLVKVAFEVKEKFNQEQALDDIELEEGNEIIFSTPDPEIPVNFINYLSETISPILEVDEVYVFETMLEGDTDSGLVIGVVPSNGADTEKIDNLAFILVNGIEKYLEDRDQIDFMILDDDELVEIAQSVSPEILLSR